MRVTKADWILLAFVFTPILTLVGLLASSSYVWIRNSNEQRNLIAGLIQNEPALAPVRDDESREKIRNMHELLISSSHAIDWETTILTDEERKVFHRPVGRDSSSTNTPMFKKLRQKTTVLNRQMDELIYSPDASIEHAYSHILSYASFRYGGIDATPFWLFERVPMMELQEALSAQDPDRALIATKRLLELLVPSNDIPMSWGKIVYLPSVLAQIRAMAVSGHLSAEQFAELDRMLSVAIDWDATWAKERSEFAWLIGDVLKTPKLLRTSDQLMGYQNVNDMLVTDKSDYLFAPSETLAIARASLPPRHRDDPMPVSGSDVLNRRSKAVFYGIDQWLKRGRMVNSDLPTIVRHRMASLATLIDRIQTDILFARASVGMATLKIETNGYPNSFGAFAKVGWSQKEIAEAERQFELSISNDGMTITSQNAEWEYDSEGRRIDESYTRQVRFVE